MWPWLEGKWEGKASIEKGRLVCKEVGREEGENVKSRQYNIMKVLTEVAQGSSRASGTSVAVRHSCHLQQLLWDWSTDDPCPTRGWNQPHQHRTTLASHLKEKEKTTHSNSL